MRIVVEHGGYEMLNIGDAAMLQVAVRRLRALWPGAEIHLPCVDPRQLPRHCPGTVGFHPAGRTLWLREENLFGNLYRHVPYPVRLRLLRAERFARGRWPALVRDIVEHRTQSNGENVELLQRFLDAVLGADLVIAAGGGYITDDFDVHALGSLETLALAQALGTPTALLGQGIGPITRDRLFNRCRDVLTRADLITLREARAGIPLVRSMGVDMSRVSVTGDDAIEAALPPEGVPLPAARDGIGVNLRTTWYSRVCGDAIDVLRRALRDAAERYGAPLVPLPVSRHDGGEDARAIDGLLQDFPRVRRPTSSIETAAELIAVTGTCRIVVTASYHGGVFALSQGIPTVALVGAAYYVDKFRGLAEQFGTEADGERTGGQNAAAAGLQLLSLDDPEFPARLAAAIERAWASADAVGPVLRAAAYRQVRAARAAYERLGQIVNARAEARHGFRRFGRRRRGGGGVDLHRRSDGHAPGRVGAHAGL
jgi:colanic acid/amylovoran biosynthesis protein